MQKVFGFTLVELLVVMAIMSILSVITFGQFRNAQRRARDVQRKSDLSTIYKAVSFYMMDYGKVPNVYDLADSVNQQININGLLNTQSAFIRDSYTYVQKLPKESIPGVNNYCYVNSVDGKGFGVFAVLESKGDSDCRKYVTKISGACGVPVGAEYNYALLSPNVKLSDLFIKDTGIGYTALEDKGGC